MSWIQTYTGKQAFPLAMTPEMVCLEDIAHALSMKCRFNGHCDRFYSVAEHSVRVMLLVLDRGWNRVAMQRALLHDAAEAYLPDVCRPLKKRLSIDTDHPFYLEGFGHVESCILDAVADHFQLGRWTALRSKAIKHADNTLLATEARDLMGTPPAPWEDLPPPLPYRIRPWTQQQAKQRFLEEAAKLGIKDPAPAKGAPR